VREQRGGKGEAEGVREQRGGEGRGEGEGEGVGEGVRQQSRSKGDSEGGNGRLLLQKSVQRMVGERTPQRRLLQVRLKVVPGS